MTSNYGSQAYYKYIVLQLCIREYVKYLNIIVTFFNLHVFNFTTVQIQTVSWNCYTEHNNHNFLATEGKICAFISLAVVLHSNNEASTF